MNPTQWTSEDYLILGYVVSVVVLWGYAALLLLETRALKRRESSRTT